MSYVSDPASLANQCNVDPQLPSIKEAELFEDQLIDVLKDHANNINNKVGGIYDLQEKIAFKQLYNTDNPQSFRPIYRKCFDLLDLVENIAGGDSVTFPHMIDGLKDSFMIFASCVTTSSEYFTVVYPDIYLTADSIKFTNPHAQSLQSCTVVAEYTKT